MWRDGDYKRMCFGGKQDHKENPLRRWSEWWEPGARARLGVDLLRLDRGLSLACHGFYGGRVDGDTKRQAILSIGKYICLSCLLTNIG